MTSPSDIQLQFQSTPDVASVALDRLRAIFDIRDVCPLPTPHPQHQVHLQLTVQLIDDAVGCPNCGFSHILATEWMCPNCDATIRCDSDDVEIIEVYNAWTIYAQNADGSQADQPIACHGRPQDWGDPRWTYNEFRFDWIMRDKTYINHCHCWTDLQREAPEYPSLFAPFIVQSLWPGLPKPLCGRDYLAEDDFWSKDWGAQPPTFDPYENESWDY